MRAGRRRPARAAAASRSWSAASFCERSNSSARALLIGFGALPLRVRRADLRLGLGDDSFLRFDLSADSRDRRVLRGDLGLGRIDHQLVIAIVDSHQEIAGVHRLVLGDGDLGHVTGNFRRDDRHVGADIGVVGGDQETALDEPVIGQMRAIAEAGEEDERQNEASRRTRPGGCPRRRRRFRGRDNFARTRRAGDRRRIFWPAGQRRRRRLNLILLHRRRLRTRTEPFGHFKD